MTVPTSSAYQTVIPYFAVTGVSRLIEFLTSAFGALEIQRHALPDGTVRHAEIKIGDSTIMLGELPQERQPKLAMLYMYVDDVDVVYHRAIQAGGVSVMEPTNQYYGDRSGAITDPSGNEWWIATHVVTLSEKEMMQRDPQYKK